MKEIQELYGLIMASEHWVVNENRDDVKRALDKLQEIENKVIEKAVLKEELNKFALTDSEIDKMFHSQDRIDARCEQAYRLIKAIKLQLGLEEK